MKELKWMTPVVLAVAVAACGGSGGDSSQRAPRVEVSFQDGIKGPQAAPELKNVEITTDATVEYNSHVTGTIGEDSELVISFVAPEDKTTLVRLTGSAPDADLDVEGTGVDMTSAWLDTSNEMLVFEAVGGRQYSVTVSSEEGSGDFALTIVEANRSSAGLSSHEYLLELENRDKSECTETGEEDSGGEAVSVAYQVISWKRGYIYWGKEKLPFKSTDGNTFTTSISKSENVDGLNFSEDFNHNLSVTNAGKVSGKGGSVYEEVSDDGTYQYRCVYEYTLSGDVIL